MSETPAGLSRRTLAKGAAWAAPAVAVAAAAPAHAASVVTTTTTLPPCLSAIVPDGGTYPVTYDLSGCTPDGTHWDFRFRIQAATQDGTDCQCSDLRITLYDNPRRSRLWIVNMTPDPSTNKDPSPQLYLQKVLPAGAWAFFPAPGDQVRRVDNNAFIGSIQAWGGNNDAMHVLMNADGTLPCSTKEFPVVGPMAYYKVECRSSADGTWTQLGADRNPIWPSVPMIHSTVCQFGQQPNYRYRLGISVLNNGGVPPSDFSIRRVRRNANDNSPSTGNDVWTGQQTLTAGMTYIETTSSGSGSELWIEFTTDNGANFSWIRVDTTSSRCTPGSSVDEEPTAQSLEEQEIQEIESTTATTATSTTSTSTSTTSTSTSTTTEAPAVETNTTTQAG